MGEATASSRAGRPGAIPPEQDVIRQIVPITAGMQQMAQQDGHANAARAGGVTSWSTIRGPDGITAPGFPCLRFPNLS